MPRDFDLRGDGGRMPIDSSGGKEHETDETLYRSSCVTESFHEEDLSVAKFYDM